MNVHSNSNSALPFEVNAGFTAIPNVVLTHYSFFPKFNGNVLRVYAYLLKMNNAEYGYAFPTQDKAAQTLGITEKTFSNSVRVLIEARLIRSEKNRPYNNLVYYFEAPIEDEAVFYATFPQAAEVKRKSDETWAKITPVRQASKDKLSEWF